MSDWSSSWVILEWSAAALFAALVLPYLLPAHRRYGGSVVRLVLALAVGLSLAAAAASTTEMDTPGRVLHLGAILALVCGLVGLGGLVLFDFLLRPLRFDVPSILREVIQIAVAAVAVMVCLRLVGIDVLPLLTTSAVLTAVIGLALQSSIANVFSGLALQLDRTLGHGDWIETGAHSGRIVEIGWRSTQLVTKDGDTLFLPNSQLLSGEVLNLSRPTGAHRTSVRISVHERHPPGSVRQLLIDGMSDVPGVLAFPPPDALIVDFEDGAIVYGVRYWITEFERDAVIASEVRSRLWYAARRAGFASPRQAKVVAWSPDVESGRPLSSPERDQDARLTLLRGVDLLAPLDAAGREHLAARMRTLDFTAGEPIFHQGGAGDALYLIERGEVGVRIEVDGSSAEVATLHRGDLFGEIAPLTGQPRSASCVARTEVTCHVIDRDAFEGLLADRPEVAAEISSLVAARQAAYEAQRENLTLAVRERLEGDQRQHVLSRLRDLFGRT